MAIQHLNDDREKRERSSEPVDMDALERTLGKGPIAPVVQAPSMMQASVPNHLTSLRKPPLLQIAQAIKLLVWDDNEKLGTMIHTALGGGNIQEAQMSKAVQKAADDLIKDLQSE